MVHSKISLLALSLLAAIISCTETDSNFYGSPDKIDNTKTDVFYIVSLEVMTARDAEGQTVYKATLSEEDKSAMIAEMNFAQKMFGNSFNFFAPFYHQYTYESLGLPKEEYMPIHDEVAAELCDLFDEYMSKYNNGRNFILTGFSQGAEMIPHILRHMNDEQYSRMAAAYMLGFQLSEEDLKHPHIKAAKNAYDYGETVSFNSVLDVSDRWDFVSSDPACCINPVNWKTDTTAASFQFNGDTLSVSVNQEANLLIINCKNPDIYRFPLMEKYCTKGNLHHWDLMFFGEHIRKNAILRAYSKKKVMTEIERKFLVKGDFRKDVFKSCHISQGYLNSDPQRTVRIRIKDDKGFITIKGTNSGPTRFEWEKEIPVCDAETLLEIAEPGVIDKIRHLVHNTDGKHIWEIDEFHGDNEGLIVAEIELEDAGESFDKPEWIGDEVTSDARYYNSMLAVNPYKNWIK